MQSILGFSHLSVMVEIQQSRLRKFHNMAKCIPGQPGKMPQQKVDEGRTKTHVYTIFEGERIQ